MKQISCIVSLFIVMFTAKAQLIKQQYEFLNFSDVNITDSFWKPKMDLISTVTLKACIDQTEIKTPRIRNFIKVANKTGEKHEGIYYDDSDVFKAIEAMAYTVKNTGDKTIEKKADEWIDIIAAAQLPDGYLNTYYTLTGLDKRWTDAEKHEDYNAGHLIEAAVAYYDATGKRKLLDVAIRFANHIDSVFRLANRHWFSGHQEIELALVKLYKTTNDDRYLKLADWYLQQRGKNYEVFDYSKSWIKPDYWQEQVPVYYQKEITGHAVRAMYLYTGSADVGALTGDENYMKAMQRVWQDVVYRNMYITGGIGAAGDNEGFTTDYDLPNQTAYCETCASVGMVFWNQRMAQLTGDATYIDVLEKSLYNAALDGLSLSGDHFFYDNPLASMGQHKRKEWFGTACCPSNISRLIASLGDYIYAKSATGFYVNLFVGSNTKTVINNTNINFETVTDYPISGTIKIKIKAAASQKFILHLRLPGWATGIASPGNLYRFSNYKKVLPIIKVNGNTVPAVIKNGYVQIDRIWGQDDVVEYILPIQPLKVVSDERLSVNKNKTALQYGPIIYCIESADNNDSVWDVLLPQNSVISIKKGKVLSENIMALHTTAQQLVPSADGKKFVYRNIKITAIPYYTWANRGAGNMLVWIPTRINSVLINSIEKNGFAK